MRDVHSDEVRAPALRMEGFEGEWSETTLGNLAESFSYGLNAPAGPYDGKTKYLRITDIDEDSRRYNQQSVVSPVAPDDEVEKYLLEHDDLLLARAASVGRSFHVSGDYGRTVYAGYLIRVRLLETASPLFVFYYTLTGRYWDYIRSTSQRSSQAGVNAREYADLPVFLPGSSEQLSVAGVFEAADSVMEGVRQQVELLTSLKKTMLVKMFPQGTASTPEVRFEGFEGEWKCENLGTRAEVKSAARVHRHEWTTSGVPFFRASDVSAIANGVSNPPAFISHELYENLVTRSGRLRKGDVLVVGGGSIGTPYVVPDDKPLYSKDADLLWVQSDRERLSPEYLAIFFRSPSFQQHLRSISHAGTISHYTIVQAKNTPIPLPSLPEQQAIGAYFRSLDALIDAEQKKLDTLRNLKSALLTQMFV